MKTDSGIHIRRRFRFISRRIGWFTRVSGLLVSVISMHLLIVRPLVNVVQPMVERVDQLQVELHEMSATLSRVATEHSTIESTRNLLADLRSQHEEIAGARATLQQLQRLREEIQRESSKLPDALEAVNRLSELPDHLFQAELGRYSTMVSPAPQHPTFEMSAVAKGSDSDQTGIQITPAINAPMTQKKSTESSSRTVAPLSLAGDYDAQVVR